MISDETKLPSLASIYVMLRGGKIAVLRSAAMVPCGRLPTRPPGLKWLYNVAFQCSSYLRMSNLLFHS